MSQSGIKKDYSLILQNNALCCFNFFSILQLGIKVENVEKHLQVGYFYQN